MKRDEKPPIVADLKFDVDAALAALERTRVDAIRRATSGIEQEHSRLVASLKAAESVQGIELAGIAQAERAVVIDFDLDNHMEARQLGLQLGHQYGWERHAELSAPLRAGSYRAVILVTRRP